MARVRFHEELDQLEVSVLEMGERSEQAVSAAVRAFAARDAEASLGVIAGDDDIDARYLDIERRTLGLLALQTPVATDLRLLSAILHINLHLERVGDMAVNIAKTDLSVKDLPASPSITTHLVEMGDILVPMLRTAMDAMRTRDLDLCLRLPAMDDPLDRLNLGIYQEVADLADDPDRLQWGLRMVIIARQLERVGDHAVDIGEQIGFLLTGEFREFTDASHPDG